jgi:hypothetical protein
MPIGPGSLLIGSTTYRAYDLSGSGLWLAMHSLTDDTGSLVTKSNPLSVGGAYPVVATATIASGQSLSGAIDLDRATLSAIIMPAAWTAASVTFQVSADGGTYVDLYDSATERAVSVTTSRAYSQSLSDWAPFRYVKIRSGTSASPVSQGAARVITLIGVV